MHCALQTSENPRSTGLRTLQFLWREDGGRIRPFHILHLVSAYILKSVVSPCRCCPALLPAAASITSERKLEVVRGGGMGYPTQRAGELNSVTELSHCARRRRGSRWGRSARRACACDGLCAWAWCLRWRSGTHTCNARANRAPRHPGSCIQ